MWVRKKEGWKCEPIWSFGCGGIGEWVCSKRHQSSKIFLHEGIKDAKLRTPSPPHQLQYRRSPAHSCTPHSRGGSMELPWAISQPQGRTGWSQHGTVSVLHVWKAEKLHFSSSARTVLMCLSHRTENFFRGWELSDSYCPCSGSADEHLCHITLSLQGKVAGKVPGSTHPYGCSGLCLLLAKYLRCLRPTRILADFWHNSPKMASVSFSYLSGVQSLAGTPEHCLSVIHKLLEMWWRNKYP